MDLGQQPSRLIEGANVAPDLIALLAGNPRMDPALPVSLAVKLHAVQARGHPGSVGRGGGAEDVQARLPDCRVQPVGIGL